MKSNKLFNSKSFLDLYNHTETDLKLNAQLFFRTIDSANTPYYDSTFNRKLSSAIIPNIIRLIKSAIWLALALPFCIVTFGHFINMNKVALAHFANLFVCFGNIGLSIVVPLMRNYHSWNNGYLYNYSDDYYYKVDKNKHNESYLKALTWQNKITFQNKLTLNPKDQIPTINEDLCLLSDAERYVFGLN